MHNYVFTLLSLCFLLTSCAPIAIIGTGVATSSIYSIRNEKGLGGKISDFEIAIKVKDLLWKNGIDTNYYIFMVKNSDILITGYDKFHKKELIEKLLKNYTKIHKIYNEISDSPISISQGVKDGIIRTKINSQMLADNKIRSLNYDLIVRGGITYLIGLSSSNEELERVLALIHKIDGVKKIVYYVGDAKGVNS